MKNGCVKSRKPTLQFQVADAYLGETGDVRDVHFGSGRGMELRKMVDMLGLLDGLDQFKTELPSVWLHDIEKAEMEKARQAGYRAARREVSIAVSEQIGHPVKIKGVTLKVASGLDEVSIFVMLPVGANAEKVLDILPTATTRICAADAMSVRDKRVRSSNAYRRVAKLLLSTEKGLQKLLPL